MGVTSVRLVVAASLVTALAATLGTACGSSRSSSVPDALPVADAPPPVDAPPAADAAPPPPSKIKHVIVIVQENHTFDAYFGRWCTAPAGSAPSCTAGPSCCEAAPATDPGNHTPVKLDDSENGRTDRNHTQACEQAEMNGGAMDRYGAGASGCSDPANVAIADDATVATYHDWASTYAIADRYFQPEIGSSSANDMYFAVAHHVFTDNTDKPDTNGKGCTLPATRTTITGQTTIADLLIAHGDSFAFYAQGYADMVGSLVCPLPPSDCPLHLPTTPCDYDPSDVPFEYYAQFADNATYMKDWNDLAKDVAAGALPAVAFAKGVGYKNEHPGYGTLITPGEAQVKSVVDLIATSPYASDTLILVTWDEGGGFWDHVPPPAAIDAQPYGTRVPLIVIGTFARRGVVSHVQLEHASIVKFLEWNFLGDTGQLGARDALVNNLGSLLDPAKTGRPVPLQ